MVFPLKIREELEPNRFSRFAYQYGRAGTVTCLRIQRQWSQQLEQGVYIAIFEKFAVEMLKV